MFPLFSGQETRGNCALERGTPARNTGLPAVACGQNHIGKEAVMTETWSGEFYCVKCKAKREASGEVHVSDKGTRMAKGICPVCGTKLNRILGKA
jgi:uncharacterized protein DUF5679